MEWLEERFENCLRISEEKTGKDRDGWLEDAAYFAKTIAIIRTLAAGPTGDKPVRH